MADGRKYYVLCDQNCKFESMTKEQILTAITQALNEGAIGDIDTGFITTIKTINDKSLRFFVGEQSEYEALTNDEKVGLFALITNDTSKEGILNAIEELMTRAETLENWKNAVMSGETIVSKANHATNADSATNADHATKATNADYATYSEYATNATNADKATNATNADHATSATKLIPTSGSVTMNYTDEAATATVSLEKGKTYALEFVHNQTGATYIFWLSVSSTTGFSYSSLCAMPDGWGKLILHSANTLKLQHYYNGSWLGGYHDISVTKSFTVNYRLIY